MLCDFPVGHLTNHYLRPHKVEMILPMMNVLIWILAIFLAHPFAEALSLPTPLSASSISRRSFIGRPFIALAGLSTVPSAVATTGPSVSTSVSDGMAAFASGNVDQSIQIYDAIIEADPRRKPFLWQRGLSLYYAGRYEDGAQQFAADVAVNPNDTEEQIWHLLCLAQVTGSLEEARPMKLTVGKDRRPVMRAVQNLFLSGGLNDKQQLMDLAENGDVGSRFYASLYLSLYYESLSNVAGGGLGVPAGASDAANALEAEKWMARALGTDYAKLVGRKDPMVDLAKVAVNKRGWSSLVDK